jgi:hypothetical protein
MGDMMRLKKFKYTYANRERGMGEVEPVFSETVGSKTKHLFEVVCPQTKILVCSFYVTEDAKPEIKKRGRPKKVS